MLRELGRPDSTNVSGHPFDQSLEYSEWSYRDFEVLLAPAGAVVSMTVRSGSHKTRRGIGVGSLAAEVLAAYGPPSSGAEPDGEWAYIDPAQELHYLLFRLAHGQVVQVSFGYYLD